MKKLLLPFVLVISSFSLFAQQLDTMKFNTGSTEPDFTLSGWNSGGGTIWLTSLTSPGVVQASAADTFSFISFDIGPFNSSLTYTVTSNLGHSYSYNATTDSTHTLNWFGVTSVSFSRIGGSGQSADHDNFVYSYCRKPETPVLSTSSSSICSGGSDTLNISGNLKDATLWHVYNDSCGGTLVGTTSSNSILVSPTTTTTTYYVRGEDGNGCIDESSLSCTSTTLTPSGVDTSYTFDGTSFTANANNATYEWLDCDFGYVVLDTAQTFTPFFSANYALAVNLNGCVDTTACFTYIFSGLNALEDAAIHIYPNPSNGLFNIDLKGLQGDYLELRVTDLLGHTVYSKELDGGNSTYSEQIDISKQSNAVYFVNIYNQKGLISSKKLIKE